MPSDVIIDQNEMSTGSNSSCSRLSLFGLLALPCAAALYFLSHPIMSFIAREACYHRWGNTTFRDAPFNSLGALVTCEYAGAAGFNWQQTLDWAMYRATYIMGSITSLVGSVGFIGRCLRRNNQRENSQVILPTTTHDIMPQNPQAMTEFGNLSNDFYKSLKTLANAFNDESIILSQRVAPDNVHETKIGYSSILPSGNNGGMINSVLTKEMKSLTPAYGNQLNYVPPNMMTGCTVTEDLSLANKPNEEVERSFACTVVV